MVRHLSRSGSSFGRDSSIAASIRLWAGREKPLAQTTSEFNAALAIFPTTTGSAEIRRQLQWYAWWLHQNASVLPTDLQDCIRQPRDALQNQSTLPVVELFLGVATLLLSQPEPSIDSIVDALTERNLLLPSSSERERISYRTLVFAILGWQTMLYQPAFGDAPSSSLAVVDELDGHQGQAFLALKQDQEKAEVSIDAFLLGFGLLIPPKNACISEDPEEQQAFNAISMVECGEFNANLLESIAHIKFKWVDTLSIHLEYNRAANTLYLFRRPSFCIANIPSASVLSEGKSESVIHSCASSKLLASSDQYVSTSDITAFLQEVILSYRLLFGQNKASRQLYRNSIDRHIFASIPPEGHDLLLSQLCGRKSFNHFSTTQKERSVYQLSRDFPMLRCRLAILKRQLEKARPRGWRDLWRDKRDEVQWITFWAVIVIGGAGLMLSLVQVVLQVVQVVYSKPH